MNPALALSRQATAHLAVALLLAASLWWLARLPAPQGGMAVAWAVLAGLLLSHIAHEWCHYGGGRLAGASLPLKANIHPLFFDVDFPATSGRQFLGLSLGGPVGNALLVAVVGMLVDTASALGAALLAAVAGQLAFVLILELPVSRRVLQGQAPFDAVTDHFGQGAPVFLRALAGGIATGVAVFLLARGG